MAEHKRKNAERQRRYKQKKNASSTNSVLPSSPFSTPQFKGKVLKQVRKALTGSGEQNFCVLKTLLDDFGDNSEEKRVNGRALPQGPLDIVEQFFFSDEISRASPNVSDFVTVERNGQKVQLSVKHLMYSLKETFGMFKEENPGIKIGISKFKELRPDNVLSFSKLPHNICVCQIHENLRCCLKSLSRCDPLFSNILTDYGMYKNFVCTTYSEKCFDNCCEDCQHSAKLKEMAQSLQNRAQNVKWMKWVKVQKGDGQEVTTPYCNIEKVQKNGSIEELLQEIYDQAVDFLDHEFIKLKQSKSSESMIKVAMSENSENAVICCDFAEKFKCVQQNAPQSAHYGQTPVSLFTIALYHHGIQSIVIASDFEKNTKDTVLAYLQTVMTILPATVKNVDIWSDNAGSQFKNQFIMEGMKTLETLHEPIKIRWNFYAAMHGKSVVDGIGGSVKRWVRRKILNQDLIVKCAQDFVQASEGIKIDVKYLSLHQIKTLNEEIGLSDIVKKSKKIQDIKKNHRFETVHEQNRKKNISKVVGTKISPN